MRLNNQAFTTRHDSPSRVKLGIQYRVVQDVVHQIRSDARERSRPHADAVGYDAVPPDNTVGTSRASACSSLAAAGGLGSWNLLGALATSNSKKQWRRGVTI